MKITAQLIPAPLKIQAQYEPEDQFHEGLVKAWEDNSGEFELQGFRKGRAPLEIAYKRVGIQKIIEVVKPYLDGWAEKILKEVGKSVRIAALENVDISKDFCENLTPVFTIFLYPYPEVQFKDLNFENLAIPMPSIEDGVDSAIKDYASRMTTSKQTNVVTGRSEVTLDVKYLSGNSQIGFEESRNIKIGNQTDPFYEINGALMGQGLGFETVLLMDSAKFPDYTGARDFAISIKIISIRELEFPVIDDEFAIDSGFKGGLEHMKADYRYRVCCYNKEKLTNEFKKILVKIARDKCVIIPPLPRPMIESYVRTQWEHEKLKKGHVSDAELANIIGMSFPEMVMRNEGQVKFMLENRIVMTGLSKALNIEISEIEYKDALKKFFTDISGMNVEEEIAKVDINSDQGRSASENALMDKCFKEMSMRICPTYKEIDRLENVYKEEFLAFKSEKTNEDALKIVDVLLADIPDEEIKSE